MDLPSLPSLSSLFSASSGINWRDNLYDASFRGVPFSVESDEVRSDAAFRSMNTQTVTNRTRKISGVPRDG